MASILAKYIFEKEVERLSKTYGIDFERVSPNDIPVSILSKVAKLHFKNIKRTFTRD